MISITAEKHTVSDAYIFKVIVPVHDVEKLSLDGKDHDILANEPQNVVELLQRLHLIAYRQQQQREENGKIK